MKSVIHSDNGCWIWTGRIHENGYGIISYRGVEVRVHVGAWVGVNGPKPKGMDLDHTCRVRPCLNPAHLELVTRKENLNRGSGNKGEVNGHAKLTEEQVRFIKKYLADHEGRGGTKLAKRFGVSPMTISNIKTGKIWGHVE